MAPWGEVRQGAVRSRRFLGQEAQGCANTWTFFITGAEGPLHIGDYYGY